MDEWQLTAANMEGFDHVPSGAIAYMRAGHARSYPLLFASAEGAYAIDTSGRRYVDWVMGKGPVTLGHGREEIDRAAFEAARSGILLPGLSRSYARVATRLSRLVPAMESITFAKNGSDAVAIALRLARVHSGRGWVLSSGYHGWDERVRGDSVGATLPSRESGVADFGYDLDLLERVLDAEGERVAAVLVSPEPAFLGDDFLRRVAASAKERGALFIVDEVRCGMRLALGGAHDSAGVRPDLVAMSKGLTNGYPLAAVGGLRALMDASRDTFIFGTYYGETASLAAADACLEIVEREGAIESIAAAGHALSFAMGEAFVQHGVRAHVLGPAAMPTFLFESRDDEATFYGRAAEAGVLFFQDDAQCPSTEHGATEVQATLTALAPVFDELSRSERSLAPAREVIERYAARRGIREGVADAAHIERTLT